MRMLIKRLLKKHKYPPEGMDDAVRTVMDQCELWTDNADVAVPVFSPMQGYGYVPHADLMAAEEITAYGKK